MTDLHGPNSTKAPAGPGEFESGRKIRTAAVPVNPLTPLICTAANLTARFAAPVKGPISSMISPGTWQPRRPSRKLSHPSALLEFEVAGRGSPRSPRVQRRRSPTRARESPRFCIGRIRPSRFRRSSLCGSAPEPGAGRPDRRPVRIAGPFEPIDQCRHRPRRQAGRGGKFALPRHAPELDQVEAFEVRGVEAKARRHRLADDDAALRAGSGRRPGMPVPICFRPSSLLPFLTSDGPSP